MFGQGKLTVEKILCGEPGDCFKYVRHSKGFSFDTMLAAHKFMVPEGCEVLSAGVFYMRKDCLSVYHMGSITLKVSPDSEDPQRLSEIFRIPCEFEAG